MRNRLGLGWIVPRLTVIIMLASVAAGSVSAQRVTPAVDFNASFSGSSKVWQGCETRCGWYLEAVGVMDSNFGSGRITLQSFWTYPEVVVQENWSTAKLEFEDGSTLTLEGSSATNERGTILAHFYVVGGTGRFQNVKAGSLVAGYQIIGSYLLAGQIAGRLSLPNNS